MDTYTAEKALSFLLTLLGFALTLFGLSGWILVLWMQFGINAKIAATFSKLTRRLDSKVLQYKLTRGNYMNSVKVVYADFKRVGEEIWHVVPNVQKGQAVRKGQPVATVETDMGTRSFKSPIDGHVSFVDNTAIDNPCDVVMILSPDPAPKQSPKSYAYVTNPAPGQRDEDVIARAAAVMRRGPPRDAEWDIINDLQR
jgi:phosphoglycolate phosphatase-like HAD superfamily hydrolase